MSYESTVAAAHASDESSLTTLKTCTLFEVGRRYRISTGVGDEIGHGLFRVIAIDGPLLKLEGQATVTVINTHASSFHCAEIED